jgi:hypothetical protein
LRGGEKGTPFFTFTQYEAAWRRNTRYGGVHNKERDIMTTKTATRWSAEEEEALHTMVEQHETLQEAFDLYAARHDRTPGAVQTHWYTMQHREGMQREGVSVRALTIEEIIMLQLTCTHEIRHRHRLNRIQ